MLASAHNKTIKLWDPTTNQLQHTLTVDGEINSLRFSRDSPHLITNLGSFCIQHWYVHDTSKLSETGVELSILEGQWVCLQNKKMLWLPPEYRPSNSAVKDGTIALAHESGRVSFISALCN